MTTTTIKLNEFEFVSAEIGLVVMEMIILDGYIKMVDTFGAHDQLAKIKGMLKELDCVELNEALYQYEKATGKLGQSTYLR